jgi:hypothetical protein
MERLRSVPTTHALFTRQVWRKEQCRPVILNVGFRPRRRHQEPACSQKLSVDFGAARTRKVPPLGRSLPRDRRAASQAADGQPWHGESAVITSATANASAKNGSQSLLLVSEQAT